MNTDENQRHSRHLSILVAEDHTLIRKITRQIVSAFYPDTTYTETDNIQELAEHAKTKTFDLMILDVFLTDGNTVTILPTLKTLQPKAAILFFTMCPEKLYAKRLILNGANGFLNKSADEYELRNAIETVLRGDSYLSRKLQHQLAQEAISKKTDNPFDLLSDREFEVMLLLLHGKSVTEISNELFLHVSTIGTHKTRLFEKLKINSLMDLNRLATAHDVVT